jgi:hypothetical protein
MAVSIRRFRYAELWFALAVVAVVAVVAGLRGRYWVTIAMVFTFVVFGVATLVIMRRERVRDDEPGKPGT